MTAADELLARGWTILRELCDVRGVRERLQLERRLPFDACSELNEHASIVRLFAAVSDLQFATQVYSGSVPIPGLNRWHVDPARSIGFIPMRTDECNANLHTMWALDDFTEHNGATEIRERTGESVRAVMPAGSCLVFLASHLQHRAGDAVDGAARAFYMVQHRVRLRAPLQGARA